MFVFVEVLLERSQLCIECKMQMNDWYVAMAATSTHDWLITQWERDSRLFH